MNKANTIFITTLSILFFTINSYCQEDNEPYLFKFNRIDYFAPGSEYLSSVSKTLKNNTYITVDFSSQKVTILTYFSNEPTESIYKIKKVSELKSNNFFRLNCQATNYAEVIIDISADSKWIKRKITHNGIYHKYYNYETY